MSHSNELQRLTLAGVAQRCAQETERFFQRQRYDAQYCFELFRRAIRDANQRAWELVYDQYRPLVAGWVERHPAFAFSPEEIQYFVNRAFEKMWTAVTPAKLGSFSSLSALLRYLQMCVHSVIVDHARAAERAELDAQPELWSDESGDGANVEDDALDLILRQEFWQQINARLNNQKERLVVYCSFELGLKPREIYTQHRRSFRNVDEIYRVKENVLARLGRDDELRNLIGEDA